MAHFHYPRAEIDFKVARFLDFLKNSLLARNGRKRVTRRAKATGVFTIHLFLFSHTPAETFCFARHREFAWRPGSSKIFFATNRVRHSLPRSRWLALYYFLYEP
jgi:hypothetical protein